MAKITESARTEYRNVLKLARSSGQAEHVGNRFPWQCREAVGELSCLALEMQKDALPNSPVEVCILTASFPNYVFGSTEAVRNFCEFLEAGGKVRVVVWNESCDLEKNTLHATCQRLPGFKVRVSKTSHLGDQLQHMMVVGDRAYRLEKPHSSSPASAFDDFTPEIPAKVAFNDPRGARRLLDTFNILWAYVDSARKAALQKN